MLRSSDSLLHHLLDVTVGLMILAASFLIQFSSAPAPKEPVRPKWYNPQMQPATHLTDTDVMRDIASLGHWDLLRGRNGEWFRIPRVEPEAGHKSGDPDENFLPNRNPRRVWPIG